MNYLRKTRKAICYNQGELTQYFYLASHFHRELKNEVYSSTVDLERIQILLDNLISFLNVKFAEAVNENFSHLAGFYKNRANEEPRICLKSTYDNQIVDLFRNDATTYNTKYECSSNTGFEYVKKNGTYYFCNDIPEKAQKGLYINPRLDSAKIHQYSGLQKKGPTKLTIIKTNIDNEWINCWKNSSNESRDGIKSCYKSTIIIPLTLKNSSMSDIFLDLTNLDHEGRTIYGFLCFDHINTDYFCIDDIDLGYIFADLISLYMIARKNFTERSATYKKAQSMLR
ncbi:hypothetical protein [Maridesulfovibrio sp.]|uniref:hypothetical protein n=1 Tax=Maridesulfovibrio sp. TaxID=2795000 RepID=UPI002A18E3B6|nr:hypothetical protein [Maridesulfovibrio sp.]